jgi:hypothetical protein
MKAPCPIKLNRARQQQRYERASRWLALACAVAVAVLALSGCTGAVVVTTNAPAPPPTTAPTAAPSAAPDGPCGAGPEYRCVYYGNATGLCQPETDLTACQRALIETVTEFPNVVLAVYGGTLAFTQWQATETPL